MKRLAIALAGILIPLGGCGENPVQPHPPVSPRLSSSTVGAVTVSIPDQLYANSTGQCDLPLSVNNTSGSSGSFGSSTLTIGGTGFNIASAQMANVASIPASSGTNGTFVDTFAHQAAPYSGTWSLNWTVGGTNSSAALSFSCSLPQGWSCGTVSSKDPGESQNEYGQWVYVVFSTAGKILETDYTTWAGADYGERLCGHWTNG